MVHMDDKKISLGTLISILALLAVGLTAWVDVRSEISVNTEKNETNEESAERIERRLERMEDKLDKLILSLK